MSEVPRYPINRMADIAKIPREALPRFLAELPSILDAREQILAAAPELAKQARSAAPWPIRLLPLRLFQNAIEYGVDHGEWVDDDKNETHIKMTCSRNSPAFFERTEKREREA